jgi:hypothetical protein
MGQDSQQILESIQTFLEWYKQKYSQSNNCRLHSEGSITEDNAATINLLRKMLVFAPEKRSSAQMLKQNVSLLQSSDEDML